MVQSRSETRIRRYRFERIADSDMESALVSSSLRRGMTMTRQGQAITR